MFHNELYLESNQIPIPRFVKKALSCGGVDYFDPHYFQANKKVKFNNRTFESMEALVQEYSGFS